MKLAVHWPSGPWAERLATAFYREQPRWPLWIPCFFAIGIGIYFALPWEPSLGLPAALCLLSGLAAWTGRRHGFFLFLFLICFLVSSGLMAATWRTAERSAPILQNELRAVPITGEIVRIEPRRSGDRLLLSKLEIKGLSEEATPQLIRVVVSRGVEPAKPGDRVSFRAGLRPPQGPAIPGGFDFARAAYFDQLGAVGFAFGGVDILPAPEAPGESLLARYQSAWESLRHATSERIVAHLEGQTVALAQALILGERGGIPRETLYAMRDSGLAHLLAISGLHIGLVAGSLFFFFRAGLALFPYLALHYPIKKWAAVLAGLGAYCYLELAGAPIPTQRAFLMVSLVILGTLIDRDAISLRLVAWAAFAILLVDPESLILAGFQLSFAAVIALVSAYESITPRGGLRLGLVGWQGRMVAYLLGIAVSTLVAGLATAPFAAYHFDRIALYGLLANMIAVPLTAFWIMPAALFSLILMPIGLEGAGLALMGAGIDILIAVAQEVADLEGAVFLVPAAPLWSLLFLAVGGLWLCLWQERWRYLGLLPVILSLAGPYTIAKPDLLVSRDGRLVGYRSADTLTLSSGRLAQFEAGVWQQRLALSKSEVWPRGGALKEDGKLGCDPLGCFLDLEERGLRGVAFPRSDRALVEDCHFADVVIYGGYLPRYHCPGPDKIIDWAFRERSGALAIRITTEGYVLESAEQGRGDRPWTGRKPE